MKQVFRSSFTVLFCYPLCVSLILLSFLLCTLTSPPSTAHATSTLQHGSIDTGIQPHVIPLFLDAVPANEKIALPCLSPENKPRCYSPQQIRRAYRLQQLTDAGFTGKGTTIAIILFFQSPTIRQDLALFNHIFHLPDAKLNIFTPFGTEPFDPSIPVQASSAIEVSLDVQWAHAIAPDATLNLILARNNSFEEIYKVTKYAVDNNLGDIITQSFGGSETCIKRNLLTLENAVFADARRKGISVFASSGDTGALIPVCDENGQLLALGPGVSYPASDPLVTAVGGTTLLTNTVGEYVAEKAWNNTTLSLTGGSTGGGFSRIFPKPEYQNDIPGIGTQRGLPDISYNGDPQSGFPVVISSLSPDGQAQLVPVGGTSAGTPQWAAFTALVQQKIGKRVGFVNDIIYRVGKGPDASRFLNDITQGDNTFNFRNKGGSTFIQGYAAAPNWDPTTGFGSPKALEIANFILNERGTSSPSKGGTKGSFTPNGYHTAICKSPYIIPSKIPLTLTSC